MSGAWTMKTDRHIISRMTTPPMVGVPCLTRWPSGPSARTCWPISRWRSSLMKPGITATVRAMDSTSAKKSWKVG